MFGSGTSQDDTIHLGYGLSEQSYLWETRFVGQPPGHEPMSIYYNDLSSGFWAKHDDISEARDLGPRYTIAEDLAPIRDESPERVSWFLQHHPGQQVEDHSPIPG
nr:hypothetical protein CFP56_75416 [Quercus suber]